MNQESNNYAPVVLFVYNRKVHTQKTIEALQKNRLAPYTDIYIYSDAAKNEKDSEKVKEVREYISSLPQNIFQSINILEQKYNRGLARSIIDGISAVISQYGKVIVMEDDLITSPFFLTYMNDALQRYSDNKNVYSICGFSYFAEKGYYIDKLIIPDFYFLQYFCSWGWATWKDKWAQFDEKALGWERVKDDALEAKRFSLDGYRPDAELLMKQMETDIDSWALRWWWTIYKNNGIVLFPNRTYIRNVGWDGSGIHGAGGDPDKEIEMVQRYCGRFPKEVKEKKWIRRQLKNAFKPSVPRRIGNKIKKFLTFRN